MPAYGNTRGKPYPYGIKAFVLADSQTGYVHCLRLCFETKTDIMKDPSLLYTTQMVLTLIELLQGLGHHVIADRFYSSLELASELKQRGLAFTSTVQANRRGRLLAVKSTTDRQLQRGVRAYRAGKIMVLQLKDKRIIAVLTTSGICNIIEVQTYRGQRKQKPAIVQLYNDNMLGVDKMDELASYYPFSGSLSNGGGRCFSGF